MLSSKSLLRTTRNISRNLRPKTRASRLLPAVSSSYIIHRHFANVTDNSESNMTHMEHPNTKAHRTDPKNYGLPYTSGHRPPVWISTDPYTNRPEFPKLDRNIKDTDVVIVGAGIAGISVAYECVQQGLHTTLIDAREMLSGESSRTSGHLSSALDDRYYELIKTYGTTGARKAYDSHQYALEHVGEIAKKEGIECEYRRLPGRVIVEVPKSDKDYPSKNDLLDEVEALKKLGIEHQYIQDGKIGAAYTGAILEFPNEATYHPTKYLNGLLKVLKEKYSDRFQGFAHTRMMSHKDHGKNVTVTTEGGNTIDAKHMVMTTNVPLHVAEVIIKEAYYRTYCVAVKAPAGTYEDMSLFDNGDPYIYVRKTTHPDPNYEYIVTGGEDHKVGQESTEGYESHFDKLIAWTKAHFPEAGEAEFTWSGQIVEPNDYMAYIGRNTGSDKNVYISTGDSGNGLTHGVIAGRLITDQIIGQDNPWTDLYNPSRKPALRTTKDLISENVNQNQTYARYLKSDAPDIESLPICSGAVMHGGISKLGKPLAVYKDGEGNITKFSAICPHLHGVVAWNAAEMSWDCPVHGSRFDGVTGKCIMGPSNRGLGSENEPAQDAQKGTSG